MMKLILFGAKGKMGTEIRERILESGEYELIAGVDPAFDNNDGPVFVRNSDSIRTQADCILDFSLSCNTFNVLQFAKERLTPLVIGTTGQSADVESEIINTAKVIPIFRTVNYSSCFPLLKSILIQGGKALSPCEMVIMETHKKDKLDRPSGTAKALASVFAESVRSSSLEIHSIRVGNGAGIHEILITNGHETLTVRHEAHDRSVFAEGALKAARYLIGKEPRIYDSFEEESDT